MILPSGVVLSDGDFSSKSDLAGHFSEFKRKNFCGFLIICNKNLASGEFEQGTLFFKDGDFVACHYVGLGKSREFFGSSAFKNFLDAMEYFNVFTIVELPAVDLEKFLIFNQQLMIPKEGVGGQSFNYVEKINETEQQSIRRPVVNYRDLI